MHGDTVAIDRAAKAARVAWRSLSRADVPRLLQPLLERAVLRLGAADDPERAAQAAIGLTRLAQDLRLRHRSADAVDLRRLDTWLAQMLLDVRQRHVKAVRGDFFAIDYVRDRVRGSFVERSVPRWTCARGAARRDQRSRPFIGP